MDFNYPNMEEIDRNECIGNSLVKINSNFQTLDTFLDQLSTEFTIQNTVENIGLEGVGLYKDGTNRPLQFYKLQPGTSNVTVEQDEENETVKLSVFGVSAVNVGTGEGFVVNESIDYPLSLRTIKAGANTQINTIGNDVYVSLDTPVNGINVGPGEGEVFESIEGNDLRLKTIKAGSGVVVTNGSDYIQIDATGAGGGESNTASNLGTAADGSAIFSNKGGVDLRFKRVKAGSGVSITESANSVTINSTGNKGGITAGQNIGTASPLPIGIFKNVAGTTMRFKSIAKTGTNISVTESNDVLTINSPNTIAGAENVAGATGDGSLLPSPAISGGVLQLKKIRAGDGITVLNGAKDVIITASNEGNDRVKAWVVFSYRQESDTVDGGQLLGQPRIVNGHNVASITRMTNTALYVTFARSLPSRGYAVAIGQSVSNNDGVWVASKRYAEVPTDFPLDEINLVGSADRPYKSVDICKFESRGSSYLTEVSITFIH